jgi:phosphonate degradation associated HDIG domain protein
MPLSLSEIEHLFLTRGKSQYGTEAVSQLEHALQCAELAEANQETPETIAACLLHDLGHLLAAERADTQDHDTGSDDLHQYVALPFLRYHLPDAVLEPIRLHVDAKRYLCHEDPQYWDTLSPASKHSLEQQGGVFDTDEARAFSLLPFAQEATRLRRYDDLAKVPGRTDLPPLSHYTTILSTWFS